MLTKRESSLSQLMLWVQVALTMLLFLVTAMFFKHPIFTDIEKLIMLFQIALIWSFSIYKLQLGIVFRENSFTHLIRGYTIILFLGVSLLLTEVIFYPHTRHVKSVDYILLFAALDFIVLITFKLGLYSFMRFLRSRGRNSRNIIIIADSYSTSFIDSFIKAKDWGYQIEAIISPDSKLLNKYEKIQLFTDHELLTNLVTQNPIDDIFYCLPVNDKRIDLDQLIKDSDEIGVTVHILQYFDKNSTDSVQNKKKKIFDFYTHQTVPDNYICMKLKGLFDLLFSAVAIIVSVPVMLLIALFIKIEDRGSIFFKQERIGLNGRRFICYKFRTMVMNAEDLLCQLEDRNEADGPAFKIVNDPRITKVGRFLRKTSLDELPQFYNVLKGDMSVVGPRPPLLKEVQQYERGQLRRLSMKPGITCTWQVWGRHDVSFSEWMQMDMDYIDHWSLKLDFKIIVATVGVMFKANGQ